MGIFQAPPDQIKARGDAYSARYIDVENQPYGAQGDESTDDTLAILRAVNEARDTIFSPLSVIS